MSEKPNEPDMELYDLRVTVHSIAGRSVCGLSVGDYIELTESSRLRLPPGGHFCLYALGIRLHGRRPDPGSRLPPLLLGAWGPRGAALAGEIADEIKVGGSANPAVVPLIQDRVRVGCRAARRRLDQVRLVLGAVTVVDSDGTAARRRARTEVAKYLAVVAELDARPNCRPDSPTRSAAWSRRAVTRPRGR